MKRTAQVWVIVNKETGELGNLAACVAKQSFVPEGYQQVKQEITYDDGITPTEEREVKRWLLNDKHGNFAATYSSREEAERRQKLNYRGGVIVELTGTYTVPVPQKEKRRVEGHVTWVDHPTVAVYPTNSGESDSFIVWEHLKGKTGKFTFEED